jgi:hypothetical protein
MSKFLLKSLLKNNASISTTDIPEFSYESFQNGCAEADLFFNNLEIVQTFYTAVKNEGYTKSLAYFADALGIAEYCSVSGVESYESSSYEQEQIVAGCENLLKTIWENIKKLLKWIYDKIVAMIKWFGQKIFSIFKIAAHKLGSLTNRVFTGNSQEEIKRIQQISDNEVYIGQSVQQILEIHADLQKVGREQLQYVENLLKEEAMHAVENNLQQKREENKKILKKFKETMDSKILDFDRNKTTLKDRLKQFGLQLRQLGEDTPRVENDNIGSGKEDKTYDIVIKITIKLIEDKEHNTTTHIAKLSSIETDMKHLFTRYTTLLDKLENTENSIVQQCGKESVVAIKDGYLQLTHALNEIFSILGTDATFVNKLVNVIKANSKPE